MACKTSRIVPGEIGGRSLHGCKPEILQRPSPFPVYIASVSNAAALLLSHAIHGCGVKCVRAASALGHIGGLREAATSWWVVRHRPQNELWPACSRLGLQLVHGGGLIFSATCGLTLVVGLVDAGAAAHRTRD